MSDTKIDCAIIGGGIIGLAVAYKLQVKFPNKKIVIFEKESQIGMHQSGRNSGVLHCGLYYAPGSLKAKLAVNGIRQMTRFCQDYEIPHEICGKIVVATNPHEEKLLKALLKRGQTNGLDGLRFLSKEELKKREPHVSATQALLVPQEGIVDYKAVMKQLQSLILKYGGEVLTNSLVSNIKENNSGVEIEVNNKLWTAKRLLVCGGLYSDKLYQLATGKKPKMRIIPFRGEYHLLNDEAQQLVNHLIYPVPDPAFPFLGVHFTRMIGGAKEVGPNAVFTFKREGYTNQDFNLKEAWESLSYKGFIRFLFQNFNFSLGELHSSVSTKIFLKKAQKLIPEIQKKHLSKGTAGVRAQAMNENGELIMDFQIEKTGRQVHLLNAPSPGATASLQIADYLTKNYFDSSFSYMD